jgi:hypothetical protein
VQRAREGWADSSRIPVGFGCGWIALRPVLSDTMIDWNAELVSITNRIAEIQEKISLQSERVRQLSEKKGDPVAAISILTLLQERLKNAETHKRFVESRNSRQSIGVDAYGSTKLAQNPINDQNIETNENTSNLPLKPAHIQNITIEIK